MIGYDIIELADQSLIGTEDDRGDCICVRTFVRAVSNAEEPAARKQTLRPNSTVR